MRRITERRSIVATGAPTPPWAEDDIFAILIQLTIAQQDEYWIDRWGNVHEISRMSRKYALNALCFLHEHAGDLVAYSPLTDALRKRALTRWAW